MVLIDNSQVTFFKMFKRKMDDQALDKDFKPHFPNPLQCHFVYAKFRTVTRNMLFCIFCFEMDIDFFAGVSRKIVFSEFIYRPLPGFINPLELEEKNGF